MATEYQLSYTARDIDEKLGKVDILSKDKADKTEIPQKTSELQNDSGFLSGADILNADGIIKQEVLPEGYPYEGTATVVHVTLDESNISYSDEQAPGAILPGKFDINPNRSYTVTWNGIEYTCTAHLCDFYGIPVVGIGRISYINDLVEGSTAYTDNNEPFVLLYISSDLSEEVPEEGCSLNLFVFDGTLEANRSTLSIVGDVLRKIDNKFLPKSPITNVVDGSAVGSVRGIFTLEESDDYKIGEYSWAEGVHTRASGNYSHAEGHFTESSGPNSHAEGGSTKASGQLSHAEGCSTEASGYVSHAEGNSTKAEGSNSHAEGVGTIANGTSQHVQGAYNIPDDNDKYAHIVGNGAYEKPSNAHTLDWEGNAWFAGNVTIGEDEKVLATQEYVNEAVAACGGSSAEGVVLYTEQELTPEQQAQARVNIGAVASVNGVEPDENGNVEIEIGGESSAPTQTTDAQEHASFGEELASADGWTADGWIGDFVNGFTHTSGNTNPLIFAMPENTGTNRYQVTFESSVALTNTNLFVTIGGSDNFPLYGQPQPYGVGIQSIEDGNLMFIPESSFTGKLTNISIKRITGAYEAIPSKSVADSNGKLSFEMRGSNAELNNVFMGEHAGQYNTNGFGNVALGADALPKNTSGFWNIGVGYQALMCNTVGSRNVAAGYGALRYNETGNRNIALGSFSLMNNKTGSWNVAIGADCMDHNVSGNNNVAIGFQAMYHSQGAYDNVSIGKGTLESITDGYRNVVVGAYSASKLTTGNHNIILGTSVMPIAETATYNVAIGAGTLYKNLNGSNNVCIGTNAGSGKESRSFTRNVCIGFGTGTAWTGSVAENTLIGAYAGNTITTGSKNTCIGYQAQVKVPTASWQLSICNLIYGDMTEGQKYAEIDGGLQINALPTADPGIAGRLWNDNGTLKVSAG